MAIERGGRSEEMRKVKMIYTIVRQNELYHYGIPKRSGRYPFGSGKNPYQHTGSASSSADEPKKSERWFQQTMKNGKDRAPISPAEKTTKEAANAADNVRKLAQTIDKNKRSKNSQAKEMSDEELRERIKRLELEQRYNDLSSKDIERGRYTVEDYANMLYYAAGIAASAATIYSILKNV